MEAGVAIPSLSPEQLQLARKAATQARRERADFKQKVKNGQLSLAEALDLSTTNDVVAHIKVVDLIKTLPRVGEKRAAEIMDRLQIAPNRRLRGLGGHQTQALKAEFN